MSEDMPTEKMIEDGAKAQAGDGFVCCCNDVGLLAEDFDPLAGRILGDFPQGLQSGRFDQLRAQSEPTDRAG
jgi:hypothetical protein